MPNHACPTGIHFVSTQGLHEILTGLEAMVPDVTPQVCRKSASARNVYNKIRLAASVIQTCRDGATDRVMIRLGDQYVRTLPANWPRCKLTVLLPCTWPSLDFYHREKLHPVHRFLILTNSLYDGSVATRELMKDIKSAPRVMITTMADKIIFAALLITMHRLLHQTSSAKSMLIHHVLLWYMHHTCRRYRRVLGFQRRTKFAGDRYRICFRLQKLVYM
jgi:hypothetical protein